MTLHYREYGSRGDGRPTIVLLHGLFGSCANWHSMARRFEDRCHLLVPDLRNHGRSPHLDGMAYPVMADDVLRLLDEQELDAVHLVGHSMGGKVAMWLALEHPRRVRGLMPVDMAPVRYDHSFQRILDALDSVTTGPVNDRRDADRLLALRLESPALRAYLLQNLIPGPAGWRWRFHLPALRRCMPQILGFPENPTDMQFPGATLFVYGGRSDYVNPARFEAARSLFPYARARIIPDAGHWVYSEAPDAFAATLASFLPP
jgi:esterase